MVVFSVGSVALIGSFDFSVEQHFIKCCVLLNKQTLISQRKVSALVLTFCSPPFIP